jgi:hypothetical protein
MKRFAVAHQERVDQGNVASREWEGNAEQGCQMVCFQTKNLNLGKFCRALEWKMLFNFMVIWNILQSFGIFYGHLGMLW